MTWVILMAICVVAVAYYYCQDTDRRRRRLDRGVRLSYSRYRRLARFQSRPGYRKEAPNVSNPVSGERVS